MKTKKKTLYNFRASKLYFTPVKATVSASEGTKRSFLPDEDKCKHAITIKKGRKTSLLKIIERFVLFKQKGRKLGLRGNESICYCILFQKGFYALKKICLQCYW